MEDTRETTPCVPILERTEKNEKKKKTNLRHVGELVPPETRSPRKFEHVRAQSNIELRINRIDTIRNEDRNRESERHVFPRTESRHAFTSQPRVSISFVYPTNIRSRWPKSQEKRKKNTEKHRVARHRTSFFLERHDRKKKNLTRGIYFTTVYFFRFFVTRRNTPCGILIRSRVLVEEGLIVE